jgi:phosphoribosylformylglycinamidine synthase PurS subunit
MIHAKVVVTLKKEVSDVQGITIQQTASTLDFPELRQVRVGKYFELEMEGNGADVREKLDKLCENILSNPVIEDCRHEIVEE